MIGTRKFSASLFSQIQIEIDDKPYNLKPINRVALEKLAELTERARTNDLTYISAFYDEVALIVDAPKEFIDALPVQTILELVNYISEILVKKAESAEVKNAPTPGGSDSQPS